MYNISRDQTGKTTSKINICLLGFWVPTQPRRRDARAPPGHPPFPTVLLATQPLALRKLPPRLAYTYLRLGAARLHQAEGEHQGQQRDSAVCPGLTRLRRL